MCIVTSPVIIIIIIDVVMFRFYGLRSGDEEELPEDMVSSF